MKAELNYAVPCLEFCFVSFFGSLSTPVAGTSSVRGERTFLWQIGQSSCAQRAPQVKTLNIGLNFRPEKIKLELVLNAKVFPVFMSRYMPYALLELLSIYCARMISDRRDEYTLFWLSDTSNVLSTTSRFIRMPWFWKSWKARHYFV